ncbi:MAG: F0F1 ATP synthase subunit A, partial [Balneolales bacterium]
IELVSVFIVRPFSLAIRLFANMASGKILIFSILGIIFVFNNLFGSTVAFATSPIWILMTLFVYLIKAFIAFIQAYVFTILSALFIGMAMVEHEEIHEPEKL